MIASIIARKELKILKIYKECTDEIKCSTCKRLLYPKEFFSHECIRDLIDSDQTVDFEQSQSNLRKISGRDTSTPVDSLKSSKQ